jgi:hypothetical protein
VALRHLHMRGPRPVASFLNFLLFEHQAGDSWWGLCYAAGHPLMQVQEVVLLLREDLVHPGA